MGAEKQTTIVSVTMTKGGVGKTTTAVNLASEMGRRGSRVLLIDMDEQGNSTKMMTGKSRSAFNRCGVYTMFRAAGFKSAKEFVTRTQAANVDLLPSEDMLCKLPELLNAMKNEGDPNQLAEYQYLYGCIESILPEYDYVVIDTPPAKTVQVTNALYASDYAIIPMKLDMFSADSLSETFGLIQNLNREAEIDIRVLGIVLTMVEKVRMADWLRTEMKEAGYAPYVFQTEIHKGQAVNDSTVYGPVVLSDRRSRPAQDYRALVDEMAARMGKDIGKSEKREG